MASSKGVLYIFMSPIPYAMLELMSVHYCIIPTLLTQNNYSENSRDHMNI